MKRHPLFDRPSFHFRFLVIWALLLLGWHQGLTAAPTTFNFDRSGNTVSQQSATPAVPVITAQPISQLTLSPGELVSISVSVASSTPVTYQWYLEGTLLEGATGDSLLLTDVNAYSDLRFTVRITNSSGSVTSNPTILLFDSNGNGLGDAWELQYFGNLNQQPDADFDGDQLTNLEEFTNGTNPAIRDAYYWTAASGSFDDPANWNWQRVPGLGDTAYINSGDYSITFNGAARLVNLIINRAFTFSSTADSTLALSGSWTLNGPVTIPSGRTVRVTSGSLTLNGPTTLTGANLIAQGNNTKFTINGLTTYTQPNNLNVDWSAGVSGISNTGCELSFPNLTTITGGITTGYNNYSFELIGRTGGALNLPALTSITVPAKTGAGSSGVKLYGIDSGTLNAPLLSQFSDATPLSNSTLLAYTGGRLLLPQLTQPYGVQLDLSAVNFNLAQFVSLERTWFIRLLEGTAQINISNINYVREIYSINDGTKLSFPNVVTYTQPNDTSVEWRAGEPYRTNTGSELNFPNLTTITGGITTGYNNYSFNLIGKTGGTLNLSALTSITVPAKTGAGMSGVKLYGIDNGTLSAPLLNQFSDATPLSNSTLLAYTGGRLLLPQLTQPYGVQLDLSAVNFNLAQFVSLERTWFIRLLEGQASINLSNISYLREIYSINDGTKLSFPNVVTYTQPNNINVEWRAGEPYRTNTGSELNFPNLTTITGGITTGFNNYYFDLVGRTGGTLNLPAITSITVPAKTGAGLSGVKLYGIDSGTLNAPLLSQFSDATPLSNSTLLAYTGGRLQLPQLTQPYGVQLDLSAANFNLAQFVSLERTWFIRLLEGQASINLSNISYLREIYSINDGTKLSFPNVVTYTQPNNTNVQWRAGEPYRTNTGCELNFPNLTTITGGITTGFNNYYFDLVGRTGGTLNLPFLSSISVAARTGAGGSGTRLYSLDTGKFHAARLTGFSDLSSSPLSRVEASPNSTYRFTSLRQSGLLGVALSGVTLLTGPVNLQPPVVTSPGSFIAILGQPLNYTITASNQPVTRSVAPLPAGLSMNTSTGLLSGTPAAAGTYFLTLHAENPDGVGTLPLKLTVTPASFDEYLNHAGVPIGQRGHLDDPDKDGQPNLLEYALGLSPSASSQAGMPTLQMSGATMTFRYSRVRTNIAYTVETTTNLSNPLSWTTSGISQSSPDAYGIVTATIPATDERRFVRLKVNQIVVVPIPVD